MLLLEVIIVDIINKFFGLCSVGSWYIIITNITFF